MFDSIKHSKVIVFHLSVFAYSSVLPTNINQSLDYNYCLLFYAETES